MARVTPAESIEIAVEVNGRPWTGSVAAGETLLSFLRDRLALTGTKRSCEAQVCGVCTVVVDGLPVSSCCYLAFQADGRSVTTIEGVGQDGRAGVLQQRFIEEVASQCGYCTPGQVVAATSLLNRTHTPDRQDVVDWMSGNLCRCGCYPAIVEAIVRTAGVNGAYNREEQ